MSFSKVRDFFNALIDFVKNVAHDERIPARDKTVILALLALIISPFDLIPDWIPIIGVMDDLVMLALVLDYYFEVLDQEILLSHYPWGMKSYSRVRRLAKLISQFTPDFVRKRLWKYQPSPYR